MSEYNNSEYNNNVNTAELQAVELEMFRSFLEICKKYSFKYFLLGGSCLGAVRHGGYIPWDDDIDVGMPREDYERFLAIAPSELPGHLFLQVGKTEPDYPMNFAKIRNSETTFVETSLKKFRINHGVYLDVFPLDGYRDTKYVHFKNTIFNQRISCEYFDPDCVLKLRTKLMNRFLKLLYPNYRRVRDKREKLMRSFPYEKSDWCYNWCGAWGKRELVPKAVFGNGCKWFFEGIEVTLPENYDAYLRSLYGNYMELPPIDQRVPHHFCEVIDLKKSYKMYCNGEG